MNKVGLLIALIFLGSGKTYAQINNDDNDLYRYSYLCVGFIKGSPKKISTGFFLFDKNKIFFVSAYHVFSGWDVYNNKRLDPFPDTLGIRLERQDNHKMEFLKIGIKAIVKNSKMQFGYKVPDLFFYEVTNLNIFNRYFIYSINAKEERENISNQTPQKVIFIGFPAIKYHWETAEDYYNAKPISTYGTVVGDINEHWHLYDPNIVDSLNYRINSIGFRGNSGSPVFFEFIDNKSKTAKYTFGGVVSALDEEKHVLVVRPKYVLNHKQ